MDYLKLLQNHSEYEDYEVSTSIAFPNVSYCLEENHVHYSKNVKRLRVTYQFDDDQESYLWCGIGASSSKTNYGKTYIQRLWINGEEVSHDDILNLDNNNANVNMTGTVIADYEFNENTTMNYQGDLLKTIPGNFFYGCTEIVDVKIPDSIETIGSNAFGNCASLSSITIPETIKYVAQSAFDGYNSLTPENGVLYSNGVAYKVTDVNLGSYEIKEGTKIIVNDLFNMYNKQHNITSITIPNSVTSIGDNAFSYCSGLTSLDIPNSVTSIGESAFNNCSGLTSVTIGNSVTSIGDSAFNGCSSLTSLDIPDSVITIGNGALNNCTSLTSLTIGSGVKLMSLPIYNTNLERIVISEGNTTYDSRDNCNAIIESKTNTLLYGTKSTIIPNSVTSIANSAFSGCKGLTNITIPNSVTSIGDSAFRSCSSLTNVTIPSGVTSIGSYAFSNCGGLTNITIPNSVTSIGEYAFYESSSLTEVTIPNSVTSISNSTFSHCSGLTSVTIPDTVTSIGGYAFYSCSSLTNITIPNGVTSIGSHTFYNCSSLTEVTIPNSFTSIGDYAFESCSALTSITSLAITAPEITRYTFIGVKTNGTLYVPIGSTSTGYNTWMNTSNYYLGKYNWTIVEQ